MIQGLTKGEYDREHLKRWAIQKYFQVDQHILTDETQAQVWDAVKTFCDKWWRMQDGYYRVATGQGAGH